VDLLRGIGGAFAHASLWWVLLAAALHLGGLVVTGARWRVVAVALGARVSLWRATLINLAGIFVRNVTPTTATLRGLRCSAPKACRCRRRPRRLCTCAPPKCRRSS
jgi:uncharacterized membrane protein YbhN (UPF0104 family)